MLSKREGNLFNLVWGSEHLVSRDSSQAAWLSYFPQWYQTSPHMWVGQPFRHNCWHTAFFPRHSLQLSGRGESSIFQQNVASSSAKPSPFKCSLYLHHAEISHPTPSFVASTLSQGNTALQQQWHLLPLIIIILVIIKTTINHHDHTFYSP